jgi:chromosome segregation ATPase
LVKVDVRDLDSSVERAHEELEALPKMKGDIAQTAARVTELDAKSAYLNDMLEGVNARQLTTARDVQAARAEIKAVEEEAKKTAKELRQQAKDNLNTMAGLAVRLKEAEDSIRSTKCDLLSQTAGIRELLPPMNESTRCLELRQQGHEQVHKKLEQQYFDMCQLVEGIHPQLHELSSKMNLSENVFTKVAQEIAPVHEKLDGMRRASAAQLGRIEALAAQNTPERINMLDKQVEDLVTKLEKQGSNHESLAEVSKDSRQRIDDLVKLINRMEAKNVDDRLAVLEDGTKNNTRGIEVLETETRRLDSDLAPLGPEISRIMQKMELTDEQIGGLALGFEEARRKVVLGEDNMIARRNTPASMARKLPSLSSSGAHRGMAASPVGTETPRGTRPLSMATTAASS